MRPEEMLQDQTLAAVRGEPIPDLRDEKGKDWRYHLDPRHNRWRWGRVKSMNWTRLAMTVEAFVDPSDALQRWTRLLTLEQTGASDKLRGYGYHSFEGPSRTYGDWNAVCPWIAWHGTDYLSETAIRLMRRDCLSTAGLLALTSIPHYEVWRDTTSGRKLQYRGPHTITPGHRSLASSHRNPDYDLLLCRWLGIDFKSETGDRKAWWSEAPYEAPFERRSAMGFACLDWLYHRAPGAASRIVKHMLGDWTRPLVPLHIRLLESGELVCWMDHTVGGLGAAVFASQAPAGTEDDPVTPGKVQWGYPYPEGERVRSGSPWLGQGVCVRTAHPTDSIAAYNLTMAEAAGKEDRRLRSAVRATVSLDAYTMRLDLGPGGVERFEQRSAEPVRPLPPARSPAPPPAPPAPKRRGLLARLWQLMTGWV